MKSKYEHTSPSGRWLFMQIAKERIICHKSTGQRVSYLPDNVAVSSSPRWELNGMFSRGWFIPLKQFPLFVEHLNKQCSIIPFMIDSFDKIDN